jgi:cation diffusion facilitator CzcD-associated flavoprotein CzcO
MGIAINGYPNMFFLYGPQAPTAFANGPSCTQHQAEWLVNLLVKARAEGIDRIETTEETEEDWKQKMQHAWDITLFPKAKSWYQGMLLLVRGRFGWTLPSIFVPVFMLTTRL